MTTAAGRPAVPLRGSHRASTMTGTGTLVRFVLRREQIKMPAWVGALGLFVVYIGSALPRLAPTEDDLASVTPLLQAPVGRMFTGPAYGMDVPTYERFFAAGYAPYLVVLAALMNILLVTRHTRLEEQTGRAELVRANVAGRHATLTAALVVAAVANTLAVVVATAASMAFGFAPAGSLLVGLGTGLAGMAFAGLTAATAQLSESSRTSAGLAGAALGAAFVLRALGDMAAVGGSTLSWASPLGWAAQSAPYVLDRWWPLLLLASLAGAAIVAAYGLQGRRDLGAGLTSARPGPSTAGPALGGPLGLAARLQRGAVLGWGVAILLLGTVNGGFTQTMVDAAADLPEAMVEMFGTSGLVEGYLAFLAVFSGYLTAAYVVFALQATRAEEGSGRAEAVLATPTSRVSWLGSHLLVIAGGAVVVMIVSGTGTGLAAAAVTDDWSLVGQALWSHLNLVPAVLVVLGLGAVLVGLAPRLLMPVGWAVVALMVFVGNFAALLNLPEGVRQLSPLSHPAQLPVEEFDLAPVLVLTLLVAVGVAVGLSGFRRRQLNVA